MNARWKKWRRPILFTLGGALAGFAYYYFIGCASGSCPITSNPFSATIYAAVMGWFLSGVFEKECEGECNT